MRYPIPLYASVYATAMALLLALAVNPLPAAARSAPDSFADLVEKLQPAVVNISSTQVIEDGGVEEFQDLFREFLERRRGGEGEEEGPRRQRRANSLGSGFIIDPEGYIVTNNHVIEGADEINVRLADNSLYKATVIGTDDKTDLALLKVEPERPLPALDWGSSDRLRVGDWVVAIGNPFGLGGTVTAGIVSARQRDINSGPYDDFIQTDASINRGNSGGPLFNLDGEVIGVNTAIFSQTGGSVGIGFAIPASLARNVTESLRQFGEVRRGWLGVRIQTVTEELAESRLQLPEATGALVASVTPGGPAEAAGIQPGDVVLQFDGRDVENMRRLPRMVAETAIGKDVEVVVWRNGERKRLKVELGQLDDTVLARTSAVEEPEELDQIGDLGLSVARLSPELRQRYELPQESGGVVITEVDQSGSAAEKGLQPGDVILEVDQESVSSPADVAERIRKARDDGYNVVTLLIQREGGQQWFALRLGQS